MHCFRDGWEALHNVLRHIVTSAEDVKFLICLVDGDVGQPREGWRSIGGQPLWCLENSVTRSFRLPWSFRLT